MKKKKEGHWAMGKRWRRHWSEEHRAAASAKTKRRWESLSDETKDDYRRRSVEGFWAKNPDFKVLVEETRAGIDSGKIVPDPCDRCGGEAKPLYDRVAMELVGWRCVPCRLALRAEAAA